MTSSVDRCELAPGFSISRVLTGLWQIADMERDGNTVDINATAQAMTPYVDAGLTTFDMADHYGSAEVVAGAFVRQQVPGSVQLITKWVPKPGFAEREDVRAAVYKSLDRMQAERLDLLQFHAWNYPDPSWLDCLFWLQEMKDEGFICHLGLTNFDTAHLRIVLNSGIDIVSNQVCFSLLDQRARTGMTDLCVEHGVKLLAFGAVAGGFLTERWLGEPEPDWDNLETWSEMKYGRFIKEAGGWGVFQELLGAVDRVAKKHEVSIANVACRTILEEPSVGGVIIGARLGKSDHISDNLRLFEFELDETSRSELDAALSRLQTIPGDCGDEYRKPPFLTATGDLSHHIDTLPKPFVPRDRPGGRTDVLSGIPWESFAGYCRAVRQGNRIWVSGTTATHRDRTIGGSDPTAQTQFVIDKIEGAIQSLGGRLEDVVRTRVFVRNLADWEQVAAVHGQRFGHIQPANTLVQAALVGEDLLVEMEADAVVDGEGEST
jgi:aryl-alcohol dehydrogenase-like predicted oxidoreductase/enamine deaminase RidA (YjgF/YER057c/UK114 family)